MNKQQLELRARQLAAKNNIVLTEKTAYELSTNPEVRYWYNKACEETAQA